MASDAEINTYVDGIAASIAGVIAMAGKKRYMNDFSRIMIHMASIPNASTVDNMNPAVRESIKQSSEIIGKILTNNTKMDKDAIMGMMERETWLEPEIALSMGFVDEIVSTEREGMSYIENNIKEIYNSCMEDVRDSLCLTNTNLSMKEVINFLQLEEGATEKQILDSIKNLSADAATKAELENKVANATSEVSDKDSEIQKLNDEVNALKAEVASFKQVEIVEFVENNIEAGKLDGEKKEDLISKATNDFDGFKDIVNSIPEVSPTKSIDVIGKIKNEIPEITNLRELEQENPAKVKDLYNNNKEEYARLYKLTYGVELKK